jgi:hypothetical protein
MNAIGIAYIGGDDHRGVWRGFPSVELSVTDLGVHAAERRDLHEEEGKVTLAPARAPIANHGWEQRAILRGATGI